MAIRDISFYKYLEAAFRHKLFRERDATSFNYLGFNLTYDRIFYYARRVLPSLYSTKFPDTEAGNLQMAASVLQNLDRAQDQELKSYFDPATAPEENIPVIEEATQESTAQQAPAATPVAAGPLPGVGIRPPAMPRMPSVKLGRTPEQLGKTQKAGEPVASAGQTSEVSQPTIRTTRGFNLSGFRPPVSFVNTAKNFGSAAGRFFQRNVGKFFTAGRIASVVSGGIGAIVGAGLTNNHPIGIFGGAGAGAAGSFWIKSGDAARFLGKVGNGAINVGINISNQVSSGATRLSMSSGSKKLLWGLLGAFILFFGISLFGGLTETTPPGKAGPLPSPGGGDISKCTFTRANNPQLIKSSILAGWISNAAASAGISPAVLASVAMHENQDFVANADNNHDAIKSNRFCNRGLQFCELNGQVLHSNPNADDPCTSNEIANGARTAQAVGLMQLLDIYNPGKDLCSITENLAIAAAKLKADGITAQPTQDQINQAIRQYYNSCTYGAYSYCDEVWQDYQNCKVQPVPTPGTDFASQLVDKIKKSFACIYPPNGNNGIVHSSNAGACMNSVNPPQLTAQEIISSALSYIYLQCVGFVQAVVGGITGQFLDRVASAYMYKDFPPSGYKFTRKTDNSAIIKVGDLAIWDMDINTRPDGHVAYVVKVYDSSTFDVAEANWSGHGVVGLRTVDTNETGFAGWAQKHKNNE